MNVNPNTWSTGWEKRLQNRVHALGCQSIGEYLEEYPGEPYVAVAERLGDDVAAIQLSRMQIQEIRDQREFRHVAMDSLAREISAHLPDGWQRCSPLPRVEEAQTLWKHLAALGGRTLTDEETNRRIEFQMSGVYAYWVVLLQKYDPKVDAQANAVWHALKSLSPPTGWLPKGADDPLIVRAFDVGWPTTP